MAQRIVPHRFFDVAEEPNQTLTPIEGYEKALSVSLKEAVQPVKSLLHNADSMVETARRNSLNPPDGLTQDESAAIHLYTMQWPQPHPSLYTLLNERLRSKNRDTLISWFLFLKLFFTALYKLPSFKGTIFRGVCGNLTDQYNKDHIWWGASSCTETMNIMETFIGIDNIRSIFTIECIHGKIIKAHSYFQEENEILLMPGTYFQVVNKWKAAENLFMIHLREKTPSYQIVAPPFDLSSPSLKKLTNSTEKESISTGATAAVSLEDSDEKLTNTCTNVNLVSRKSAMSLLYGKILYVHNILCKSYYPCEVKYALEQVQLNVIVAGPPRVGKSQLISALCSETDLVENSSSLTAFTLAVTYHILENHQQQQISGVEPPRIYFYDIFNIESWSYQNEQMGLLKFLKEKCPICFIYCASPGCFIDIKRLHSVLEFCKTEKIFCALVCTKMWSGIDRRVTIQQFEKELLMFGEPVDKLFEQENNQSPHKVTLFGNGALCAMVNSLQYYAPEWSTERKPVQGVVELLHSIVQELDHEKLLGRYNDVLCRRSFIQKISQKLTNFIG